ncbi:MAG TPA: hypothetical protein PKC18_07310 [Lacipirellulaceae bacterium]|nr:hypothetical protein [Lacipirellulaceae bacterium]
MPGKSKTKKKAAPKKAKRDFAQVALAVAERAVGEKLKPSKRQQCRL